MPALENFRNSLTQDGILLEGSVLPPNNPDWGDDFRACFTPTGLKIAGGGGGTSDYPDLTNKPKINNVELNGNKTSSDLGLQPAGNYVTFDDYATASTTGVVKTSAQYGVSTSSSTKNLTGAVRTYAQYQRGNDVTIICKGTLENVLTGKGLNQIVTLTQQEYDALVTKDPNTYYYIVEG